MAAFDDIWYRSSDGLQLYSRDYRCRDSAGGARPAVLCMHGLSRNSADFAALAEHLCAGYRVLCVDQRGRGRSDYDRQVSNYALPTYVRDMFTLLDLLAIDRVILVGTSMGGLMAFAMAAAQPGRVRAMVINDIGPRIPAAGLQRVATYVGQVVTFDSIEKMEKFLRTIAATFGNLSDEQWRHMTIHGTRQLEDGRYTFAYDPGIAKNFRTLDLKDIDLWSMWDAIHCPTLVLRGEHSDVLDHADAVTMTERGPKAKLIEFPGMGHAPALMADDQIAVVRNWLLAD